ncbi:MAG: PhnA domain-containing protein [Gammaproteobacteria bacterium]|nr:PhnA domain-containing protein [Gammaproteobacteria bacterium]
MSTEQILRERSGEQCELCGSSENLVITAVDGDKDNVEKCILTCSTCHDQIAIPELIEPNHWRCLNDSMWSQVSAVQVVAWRMLNRLRSEGWPQDLLDILYLDEETQTWAEAGVEISDEGDIKHLDSNGTILGAGDTVTLTKDLTVKGANFTAKRGTAVRNISLVADNEAQIEGRINSQRIVILTKFVKKSG